MGFTVASIFAVSGVADGAGREIIFIQHGGIAGGETFEVLETSKV
jgi:hypothetical protein